MLSITESNGIVASQLRKAISEYKLKQSLIAKESGLTAQEMSDILSGRRLIRVADIVSILNVIKKNGIDANYLFGMKQLESEIQITTDANELIASITNANVVIKNGYKVVRVPSMD